MKTLFSFSLFFYFSFSLLAQSDSLTATKIFGGYKFEQNEQVLRPKALLDIMEGDQEAHAMMTKAKSNLGVGNVFTYTGSFLVGWTFGTIIGGGEFNYLLAGIGAGCLAIGIPVSSSALKLAVNAVDTYNSNLAGKAVEQGLQLKFGINKNGIGLSLTF
jgi:hypothetical protein